MRVFLATLFVCLAAQAQNPAANITVDVNANRRAINALGVQTAARFDRVDQRFDRLEAEMRTGFAEMRGRLDGAAAGQQQIVELLNTLLRDDQQ